MSKAKFTYSFILLKLMNMKINTNVVDHFITPKSTCFFILLELMNAKD